MHEENQQFTVRSDYLLCKELIRNATSQTLNNTGTLHEEASNSSLSAATSAAVWSSFVLEPLRLETKEFRTRRDNKRTVHLPAGTNNGCCTAQIHSFIPTSRMSNFVQRSLREEDKQFTYQQRQRLHTKSNLFVIQSNLSLAFYELFIIRI